MRRFRSGISKAMVLLAASLLALITLNGCSSYTDPSVSSISPSSVPVGSGDVQVTVTGRGFTNRYIQVGTSQPYGNFTNPRPTDVDTKATFTVTADQFARGGSLPVSILGDLPNRTNYSVFSSSVTLTVSVAAPAITNLNPSSIPQGSTSTVTLTGSGFYPVSIVSVNGSVHPSVYVNSSQLTFQLSSADTASIGMLNVTVSNSALGGATSSASTIAVARLLPTEQHSYGESITNGETLAQRLQAYPFLLGADRNLSVTDSGISGIETCPIFWQEVATQDLTSTTAKNVLYTEMSGPNDINTSGVGPHEAIFNTCQQAILTWLATPVEARVAPGNSAFRVTGGCSSSGTCTASGTINASLVTAGAPIYVWYEINDSSSANSNFVLTIDGSAQGTFSTHPATKVSGSGSGRGLALVRTIVSPGTHNIAVTTSTGDISVLGFGSLPATPYGAQPTLLVSDMPNQVVGQERDSIVNQQIYSGDIRANVATLLSDGLDIRFVPIRRYLSGSASYYNDNLHPNAAGHQILFQAFSDALGTIGSRQSITTTLVSGSVTPLPTLDLSFIAPVRTSSFSLPSVSSVGHAVTYYNNGSMGAHALLSPAGSDNIQIYNGLTASTVIDLDVGHSATFYPDSTNGRYLVYPH